MLSKLQPKDLVSIRNNFLTHPLFSAIQNATCYCCSLVSPFQFRPEHVFIEVVTLLDDLKEQQEDIEWDTLTTHIQQDYSFLDATISKDNLQYISTIIVCALASVLAEAAPRLYKDLSKSLFKLFLTPNNTIPRETLYNMIDGLEQRKQKLSVWVEEYMQSDEFLSEEFLKYYAVVDIQTERGTPQHIHFTEKANIAQREEFLTVLHGAITNPKKWGKAGDIKRILERYVEEDVIILSGNEIDFYNELNIYFGYTQNPKTFYAANPNLSKKLDKKI